MPTSRTKRLLFTGAAAIGVAAGAAGIAGAATGGQADPAQAPPAEADESQDPSYTSSVTAPEGDESQSEADEATALEGLATITADQARDAALATVPGTAAEVELDNENGNVVWSVEVTMADGMETEVKVDAGNGDVLAQDVDDDSESGESEADEADEGPEENEENEADEGPEQNDADEPAEAPTG